MDLFYLDRVRPILDSHLFTFRFEEDAIELDAFVRKSLRAGTDGLSASLNVTRNRISCKAGVNHWIPFAESEVDAKDAYKSHFMVDFLKSILATKNTKDLCAPLCSLWLKNTSSSLPKDDLFATNDANELSSHQQFSIIHSQFSIDASRVMDAGRALWRYYHAQPSALPDASFYDIRAHFQGFKPNGHMNPDSPDAEYTRLIRDLREVMKALASTIVPKVREHGFLR